MITDIEKFIEIQYILAEWDVNIDDCKKINDLIIELSNENKQLKYNWNKLKEFVSNSLKFYKETDDEYVKTQRELGIRDGYKIVSGKIQELEGSDSNEK